MNSRQFNARFRPIVNAAWLDQCRLTGTAANNKTARDRWYREQLHCCCGIRTTKDATPKQQHRLIDFFNIVAPAPTRVHIPGWTNGQIDWLNTLGNHAWLCSGAEETFINWIAGILTSHGIIRNNDPNLTFDRVQLFDEVMAHLAVTANDTRAIAHFAEAAEIRMRWQIKQFLADLEWLQKRDVPLSYIEAIWRQAKLQPQDLTNAPVETLAKALAMLDTHIRRMCKDYGIRPMELPSRAHPHAHPVAIKEENHHLHVGHAMEHCEPVHVTARQEEPLPF